MNTLQNMFKNQPNQNVSDISLNAQQKNLVMQLMGMNEEKRAETIAEILNKQGITKEQFQNIIKNFRR